MQLITWTFSQQLSIHKKLTWNTFKEYISFFFYSRSMPIDRCRHSEKGQPMCMEQYYRLFTTYRAPGINHDSQISYGNSGRPEPQHVLVICRNQVCPNPGSR